MVKHYEGMFLCHNKEARKDTDYLQEHVKGLIEKVGGAIVQMVKWDERKLAYPIKGVTHGVYFLIWFTGDSASDARLRGEVRLSSLILRHLTIALEKFPEHPLETAQELQARMSTVERKDGDEEPIGAPMGGRGGRDRPPRDRDRDRDRDTDDGGDR